MSKEIVETTTNIAALSVSDGDAGGGGGGRDLISGLSDDLLVRILDLLPGTMDAVRTDALSRRWRGLWTGISALRFDSRSWPVVGKEAGAADLYLASIDDALALRAKATGRCYAVNELEISFDISEHRTEELVPRSFQAAQGWIWYAAQHEVKSLILKLDLPWVYEQDGDGDDKNIIELASSAKLETMHLELDYAELRLFSFSFKSLTDIFLDEISVAGDLLSRLVSSPCCPRLRKLQLFDFRFSAMEKLLLETDTLLELSLDMMENMKSLELRTPSLRVLGVVDCYDLEDFTISAPKLEDLIFWVEQPLRIGGHLSSVATLNIQFVLTS